MSMTTARDFATDHLLLRLRPLNRSLRAAVERQGQAAKRLLRPDVAPLCVTDNQVNTLLGDVDGLLLGESAPARAAQLTPEERTEQEEMRRRGAEAGVSLPLDLLSSNLGLSAFEEEAVLLCAAPELDRSYERIYAYVLDD